MDVFAVSAKLAVLRAAEEGGIPVASRLGILLAASGLQTCSGLWLAIYEASWRRPDAEASALACVAAIDAVLAAGDAFERLDDWRTRLDTLMLVEGLSVHARAALLLRKGVIALLREGEPEAAAVAFQEGEQLTGNGVSISLWLAHRALRGVVECLAGHLTRADIHLSDAAFLGHQAHVALLPRVLVEGARGLVKLLIGEAESACSILTAVCRAPRFGELSDGMQLLMLCHRLYAAADMGCTALVVDLSQSIGARTLPAHQLVLHAYRHFALGAVALRAGNALRALVHAEECTRAGEHAACQLLVQVAALLQIQALADLHRLEDVRSLVASWSPRWIRKGVFRLLALARLEQAMLDARCGELDRARSSLAAARELQPAGEVLLPLNRNRGWLEELDTRLGGEAPIDQAPGKAHVRIRTLGEFVVEINGRRIYDRDWKGVRTKSLLIALICEGGQKVPADRLADMLWPDSEGAQAMQNLKVALHRLRRLGCADGEAVVNWVHVKHGLVSLPVSLCRVDVHEFLAALGAGGDATALAECMRCYEEAFLPGESSLPAVIAYRTRLREACQRGQAQLKM